MQTNPTLGGKKKTQKYQCSTLTDKRHFSAKRQGNGKQTLTFFLCNKTPEVTKRAHKLHQESFEMKDCIVPPYISNQLQSETAQCAILFSSWQFKSMLAVLSLPKPQNYTHPFKILLLVHRNKSTNTLL